MAVFKLFFIVGPVPGHDLGRLSFGPVFGRFDLDWEGTHREFARRKCAKEAANLNIMTIKVEKYYFEKKIKTMRKMNFSCAKTS